MKNYFGFKQQPRRARSTRRDLPDFSLAALALLSGSLAIGSAHAAPGGGGGAGSPPVDFGDLIKLYRDVNGVPHLTAVSCVQPLPSATCDTSVCELVPGVPADTDSTQVIPVDPATCAVTAACAACTEEVEFGRINEARSPDSVFETQMADVVVTLATADCVSLDPAGRLVASTFDDTTLDNLAKTIDSPLQNLAIYRQLMLAGFIGDPASPIVLPGDDSMYDTAARGLGAASDKSGGVNVDLVAYLNQIMGLSDPATLTVLGKICIDVREEVQGVVQTVEKCFLNYGAESTIPPGADYQYSRGSNFSTSEQSLPFEAYIPDGTSYGGFEYLLEVDPATTPPTWGVVQGPILNALFCIDGSGNPVAPSYPDGSCPDTIDTGFTDGNVGGFAQAADDTRRVIAYMHENQVPVEVETQVPCTAPGGVSYDVSISTKSGLQVPTNYVNGTEREFTVTVGNAGPDPATGTVTVTAVDASGEAVPGSPWINDFTNLAAGSTQSFVEPLLIDLGRSTTISWRATVEADFDVNPLNNSVTATTTVKNSGGGGNKPQ